MADSVPQFPSPTQPHCQVLFPGLDFRYLPCPGPVIPGPPWCPGATLTHGARILGKWLPCANLARFRLLIATILQVGTGVTFILQVRKQVQKGPVIQMPKVTRGISTSKLSPVLVKCWALCYELDRNDVSQLWLQTPAVGPAGLPFLQLRTWRPRALRQWPGQEPWPSGPICFYTASRETPSYVPLLLPSAP